MGPTEYRNGWASCRPMSQTLSSTSCDSVDSGYHSGYHEPMPSASINGQWKPIRHETTKPESIVALVRDRVCETSPLPRPMSDSSPEICVDFGKGKFDDNSWLYFGSGSYDAESEEEDDECSGDEDGAGNPSFHQYFFTTEVNATSPSDSLESESSSSGSGTQRIDSTPPSSRSSESYTHNNAQTDGQSRRDGSSENQISALLSIPTGNKKRKPLPFICWYPAAGTPCTAKHAKRSHDTRYLFIDHVWGKKPDGRNHRLPPECTICRGLFENTEAAERHFKSARTIPGYCISQGEGRRELNHRRVKALGITEQMKVDIDNIRKRIRNGKAPRIYDAQTMEVINQRIEGNVQLYINGSDMREDAARTELWKWYIIFKQLRPDDDVPLSPFNSKCPVANTDMPQANMLRIFNSSIEQLCSNNRLPQFSSNQREALNQAFLCTTEILAAEEDQERDQLTRKHRGNPRKRLKLSPPNAENASSPQTLLGLGNELEVEPEFAPMQKSPQNQPAQQYDQCPADRDVPCQSPQPQSSVPFQENNTLQAFPAWDPPPLPRIPEEMGMSSDFDFIQFLLDNPHDGPTGQLDEIPPFN